MRIVATSHEIQGRLSICKDWPHRPLPKEGDQIPCQLLGFTGAGMVSVMRVYDHEFHIMLTLEEVHALLAGSSAWKRQSDTSHKRAA